MKTIGKMNDVGILRQRADEIHARCEARRNSGARSVPLSKEVSAYEGILQDARNIARAISLSGGKKIGAISVWLAVTVARLSLNSYIEDFAPEEL